MSETVDDSAEQVAVLQRIIHDCSFDAMTRFLEEGLLHQVVNALQVLDASRSMLTPAEGARTSSELSAAYAFTLMELIPLEIFRWKFELIACAIRIHRHGDDLLIPLMLIRLNELVRQSEDEDCRAIADLLSEDDRIAIDWHRQWEAHIAPNGQFPDMALVKQARASTKSKPRTAVISLGPRRPFGRELADRLWNRFGEDDLRQLRDLVQQHFS